MKCLTVVTPYTTFGGGFTKKHGSAEKNGASKPQLGASSCALYSITKSSRGGLLCSVVRWFYFFTTKSIKFHEAYSRLPIEVCNSRHSAVDFGRRLHQKSRFSLARGPATAPSARVRPIFVVPERLSQDAIYVVPEPSVPLRIAFNTDELQKTNVPAPTLN